ncbi:MAG: arginase family protein [Candidatus Nanoarchaeia archaeon]
MKLIKAPFGSGGLGKTKKTAQSPDKIIAEIEEIYSAEDFNNRKYYVQEIECFEDNIGNSHSNIYEKIRNEKERFVLIGGDHSITYPSIKGFAKPNTALVVFDAHADLMDYTDQASHEDYLRKLIDEKLIAPENIILIGLRNIHQIELDYLNETGIKYFTSKRIYLNGIENICDTVMSKLKKKDNFYVSIDIDVLDPAFAPGTNHIEPGGITTRELLYFIQRLKFLKKPFFGDVVEVDTSKDINNLTTRTAAKIIKEII